jgi:tetratricopeptide (TPR) repeat protein
MARSRRSTLLLSVAALALPVALGACSTLGLENNAALTTPAPDGGTSEPVQEAAEVDAGRLLRIGAATEAVGDLENAIAMYQRALSLAPDSIEAQLALADAYRRLGPPRTPPRVIAACSSASRPTCWRGAASATR